MLRIELKNLPARVSARNSSERHLDAAQPLLNAGDISPAGQIENRRAHLDDLHLQTVAVDRELHCSWKLSSPRGDTVISRHARKMELSNSQQFMLP